MEELLSAARGLQSRYDRPVLIVLGHMKLDFSQPGEEHYSYNKIFAWDARSAADFRESTVLVAEFNRALEDENYLVYALREKSDALIQTAGIPAHSVFIENTAARLDAIFWGLPFHSPRIARIDDQLHG